MGVSAPRDWLYDAAGCNSQRCAVAVSLVSCAALRRCGSCTPVVQWPSGPVAMRLLPADNRPHLPKHHNRGNGRNDQSLPRIPILLFSLSPILSLFQTSINQTICRRSLESFSANWLSNPLEQTRSHSPGSVRLQIKPRHQRSLLILPPLLPGRRHSSATEKDPFNRD